MPSFWITGAAQRCSALPRVGTQRSLIACWRLAARRSVRTTLGSRCCTAQHRAGISSWWRSAWTWGLTLWLPRSWDAACCTLPPLVGCWLDHIQIVPLSFCAADALKGCCKCHVMAWTACRRPGHCEANALGCTSPLLVSCAWTERQKCAPEHSVVLCHLLFVLDEWMECPAAVPWPPCSRTLLAVGLRLLKSYTKLSSKHQGVVCCFMPSRRCCLDREAASDGAELQHATCWHVQQSDKARQGVVAEIKGGSGGVVLATTQQVAALLLVGCSHVCQT